MFAVAVVLHQGVGLPVALLVLRLEVAYPNPVVSAVALRADKAEVADLPNKPLRAQGAADAAIEPLIRRAVAGAG